MTQFSPSSAVDFVIVGSGAAGGIMAKQLSMAGFKVVVLEQGGWGKYGHEHDYTKDEYLNDNPSLEDRLMSDLDPDVKDDWGLPAMRITSTSHPDDIKSLEFFRQRSIEILEAAGAKKVWPPPVNDSRGGAHNRGTCRMGNDPKTSVVDRYHRAHDVFIVDGSNMVTGGRNHPTMTIQALAFRAADHLIRAARTGDMKVSG